VALSNKIKTLPLNDIENSRGGVRHIIAGKGFYEENK
jgi:hypothetical protein